VLSVAVKVQDPSDVIVTALNVATPATAAALSVPPIVQPVDPVSTTVSVEFVPVVSTLPYVSSTETLKVANTAAATTVAGGCVVNATFVAVPAVTVTPELTAVVRVRVESVAVRVHGLVPPSMIAALKVATPATAGALRVPARVHADVITIVSVAATPVVITFP
jgi:hypothetical protein